jgi:hypothetical protein
LKDSILLNVEELKMEKGLRGVPPKTMKEKALLKHFMLSTVKLIAEKAIATKAKNNGKLPYVFITKLWKEGKETFP